MKARIIDKLSVSSHRQPSDDVWRVYANHLITAFGDLLIQHGMSLEVSQKLYCEHRVRELDNEILESLIYTLPPAFIDKSKHDENETSSEYTNTVHWGASKNSPFILLGHVGTGKSTFLDHHFLHKFPKENPKFQGIIVNFLESEDNHDDFVRFLCLKVNEHMDLLHPELAEKGLGLIERLFADELASYKASFTDSSYIDTKINGLIADYIDCHLPGKDDFLKEFVKRKIDYIRKEKDKQTWVVLDNIDQLHSCLQNTALVSAVSLAANFGCSLVISMRFMSLTTPAAKSVYQSYRPRKLKLSFPQPRELIKRRLDYFKELADSIICEELAWTGYRLSVTDLIEDINKVVSLITSESFMESDLLPLSNYNIRRMLEIVLTVFQSYFFFFDRFNNMRYSPNKAILRKRFIQAHLLKNEDYFGVNRDDKESFILNLFENENKSYQCNQTIRIRLLQGLMSSGNSTTLKELTKLLLSTFNYNKYDLLQAYRSFLKSEIFAVRGDLNIYHSETIFHEGFSEEHMDQEIQISLTYAGSYHLDLLQTIEYIEIMKFSTYISLDKYLEIQGVEYNKTIEGRRKSTNKFVKYIEAEEKREIDEIVKDKKLFDSHFAIISSLLKRNVKKGFDEILKHSI